MQHEIGSITQDCSPSPLVGYFPREAGDRGGGRGMGGKMRITKIAVKGLFGMFDHEIPLNQESRITIVHGPNGVGKTVLLRMVHGLFHYEYDFLGNVQFDGFQLEFDNRQVVSVSKSGDEHLLVALYDETKREQGAFKPRLQQADAMDELIKELRPDVKRVNMPWARVKQYWVSEQGTGITGYEVFTEEDLLRDLPTLHEKVYGDLPPWFGKIQEKYSPKLILTERLSRDSMNDELRWAMFLLRNASEYNELFFPSPRDTLTDMDRYLAEKIERVVLWGYSKNTDVESVVPHTVPETFEGLTAFMSYRLDEEMENISARLPYAIAELEEHNRVLEAGPKIYDYRDLAESADWAESLAAEVEELRQDLQKYKEFQDFTKCANLLLNIINERFLFKTLSLKSSRSNSESTATEINDGFAILSEDGRPLTLRSLSSGEKQLLILFSHLLFELKPDSLILIDEPELSLNVVWQRNFLKDLQRIIELRKFDVLIATHSPQIIHDKWDWVVHLGAEADD